jgi:hypothetical protein
MVQERLVAGVCAPVAKLRFIVVVGAEKDRVRVPVVLAVRVSISADEFIESDLVRVAVVFAVRVSIALWKPEEPAVRAAKFGWVEPPKNLPPLWVAWKEPS